ncbi:DUF3841 domain-containing protein [Neofamilia massiliensis]|uniref:DUF3841 domain-containing protein n=1 Tax=Neofamilia massiliensis TaxID=1673724 RepID=UPI0006BB917B|nr:DUF3841 domain-containing protein [Neofamilia massiliensis]
MEYVSLYTRQHENSLFELETKGQITNKKIYVKLHLLDIAPFFLDRYDLFVKMAEERIKRSEGEDYPIWCSVSKYNCLKPIEKQVVYALKVPKDQVIYFDGAKWDLVLNNQYIPRDQADKRDFQKLLQKNGIKHTFDIFDRKYTGAFDDVKERIVNSWERIFEIDDRSIFKVQANLWKIEKTWVKKIIRPGDDFFKELEDFQDTWLE